ncbi:phosphonate ABC transporter substrate-binding protein [Ectothiorhodospiraceae bacterium BW-2]|nr:phosphonate ABC transporter substrate-binding protein [Ectothiorhodospiraceae bacterium BW-2]
MVVLIPLLSGCDTAPSTVIGPVYERSKQEERLLYRLAVHPLHNPQKLAQAYQPLIDYLNHHIDWARFELEASRDYQSYEAKLRQRQPDLLLPNPWQTLEAMKVGYRVIAMAGDAADFKGLFLLRHDSPIKSLDDIRGRSVSYPSPTALAAAIMPQRFLYDNGIDINREIDNRYVGSQESSIFNVLLGEVDVGVTWPIPWRLFQRDHPARAKELFVAWETPQLLNNSVMIRNDLPPTLAKQLLPLLLQLHQHPEGRDILRQMETAKFHASNDESYHSVRQFITDFERHIRPVEPF